MGKRGLSADMAERVAAVAELRRKGIRAVDIARQLGLSRHDYNNAAKYIVDEPVNEKRYRIGEFKVPPSYEDVGAGRRRC